MGRSKGGGGGKLLLFGVLCLAVGAGGWNYARNAAAEKDAFRPYKSYSLEDLQALISAYNADIEVTQQRYSAASSNRATAEDRGSLNGRLREFERVQKVGRATRELGAKLADKQVAVKRIGEEIERRGKAAGEFDAFLRRVFVYQADSGR